MARPPTINRTATEQKLRTALHLSFPKEPETEQGIIDFLNSYMEDFASRLSEQQDEASLHVKATLREDLRKELASKEDVFLAETRLQAEISRVEISLRAEIKLSYVKTAFQTALIILVVLLTTPGGTHLLEKVFAFLR